MASWWELVWDEWEFVKSHPKQVATVVAASFILGCTGTYVVLDARYSGQLSVALGRVEELRDNIKDRDRSIDLLKSDLKSENERFNKQADKLSELQKAIEKPSSLVDADARKQLDELRAKLSDANKDETHFYLSAKQRSDMSDVLKNQDPGLYGVGIATDLACAKCTPFGRQIGDVLTRSGWRVVSAAVLGPARASPTGLLISVGDPSKPPLDAVILMRALDAAGLQYEVVGHRYTTDNLPSTELLVSQPYTK